MSSMCIRDCILHGKETSICIEDHLITEIGRKMEADTTIDARGKMALPGMVNAHTHAAMSLLKGYADDMELMPWLENKIWPIEALLKPEHIYWGSRLACLEMIKTGTTAFNDMYFMMEETARAAQDSGIRAVLGNGFIDLFNDEKREGEIRCTENLVRHIESLNSPLLKASIAPHAIYTVSDQGLSWCAEYDREKELPLHIHLSDTEKEVKDCAASRGSSPVRHL